MFTSVLVSLYSWIGLERKTKAWNWFLVALKVEWDKRDKRLNIDCCCTMLLSL